MLPPVILGSVQPYHLCYNNISMTQLGGYEPPRCRECQNNALTFWLSLNIDGHQTPHQSQKHNLHLLHLQCPFVIIVALSFSKSHFYYLLFLFTWYPLRCTHFPLWTFSPFCLQQVCSGKLARILSTEHHHFLILVTFKVNTVNCSF